MPKRGDRVAPPPRSDEWDIRFGDSDAVDGWNDLCAQAPGATRDAYDAIVKNPRDSSRPGRQHRLKGSLASRKVAGETLEQWQFEVTSGGRIWYCIDDAHRRVILVLASTKHPKATE
ncbi:hypothetical protein [Cystobacter fuscus]|uniref:hypothetical protein n=1 Tax=Cystobacter fuscus TaxID=43 RepID=UPI0009715599|nr:hypothetical protein [Cystobacter fuscus]